MAVQFSKEKFFIPALAPLLYNAGIISGGVLLGPWIGIEGFAWGVLIGAFAGNLLAQFFGVRKKGLTYFFLFDLGHADLRKYIFLTLPLMRHYAETLEVTGALQLAAIHQRARDDFAEAEGFAEALDVGAAI